MFTRLKIISTGLVNGRWVLLLFSPQVDNENPGIIDFVFVNLINIVIIRFWETNIKLIFIKREIGPNGGSNFLLITTNVVTAHKT